MKFMVSSPKKPKNSPLYSVHTDMDSFIFCNDESLGEPAPKNIDTNRGVETIDFNIMATLELEENEEGNPRQCTETEIRSEEKIEGNQLTGHPSQTHTSHEEPNSP